MANVTFYKQSSPSTTAGAITFCTMDHKIYLGTGTGANAWFPSSLTGISQLTTLEDSNSESCMIEYGPSRFSVMYGSSTNAYLGSNNLYLYYPGGSSASLSSSGGLSVSNPGTSSCTFEPICESSQRTGVKITNGGSTYLQVVQAGIYGSGKFNNDGAGLAETYEWLDGNSNNEDRRGHFVTLDGFKIRIATPSDSYILGAIDPTPFIVGGTTAEWHGKYVKDIFGAYVHEDVIIPERTDEEGNVFPERTETRRIISPEYNPELNYLSRAERPEFATITNKGIIVMIDDGTCKVNSYATVGVGGIATHSDSNYKVRVLERIDDTHIRVYIDGVFLLNN